MNDTFAIIYADQGSPDLRELISKRNVAALPVGGRFRAIDFVLSNLANSGVHSVGLITQRNYKSLIDHIGSGKDWDLSRKNGGIMILPPYDLGTQTGMYRGLCEAIFAKRDFIDHQRDQWCLLLGTDAVYRTDYTAMMNAHLENNADITLLYASNTTLAHGDPYRKLALELDARERVTKLEYEAYDPKWPNICLGACLMKKELLVQLVEDTCAEGKYNFIYDVLMPALGTLNVYGVKAEGACGRITSVKSYFDLNMSMIEPAVHKDLFGGDTPLFTKIMDAPPVQFGSDCKAEKCIFGNGCTVEGEVINSVVFRGVTIGAGSSLGSCIVMQNTSIGKNCHLRNVIVDKDVVIGDNARIVGSPHDPYVISKGSVIPEGFRG
ncbi:MAG: glucose-1-phosphate adenylyltransferase subunit GlgD [Coriobacteriales bacterium]|nr:glucose-1-phosphate adenylyltransferase subunit GlgD [Coriobacteriales bacterium]